MNLNARMSLHVISFLSLIRFSLSVLSSLTSSHVLMI
jgi:hypothetical protein